MYKKNQRHLEANNMILKHNTCSKSEIQSDAYENCTPFKSKSTILTNDDSSNIDYSISKTNHDFNINLQII